MSDIKKATDTQASDVAFTYNGMEVRYDESRFIDLTQMWRAVGSPKGKEFKQWRRYEGASFISDFAKVRMVREAHLIRTVAELIELKKFK